MQYRRSPRLRGYDYGQPGVYFATVCTRSRAQWLGSVTAGVVTLTDPGKMVERTWLELGATSGVLVDEFVVMPDHVHGILWIEGEDGSTLSSVIGTFKSTTTQRYIDGVRRLGWPAFEGRLWQRSFFDTVIRGPGMLERFRRYIASNPGRWRGG